MELYRIIQDESELDSFIQNSLPDLGKDECFYVSLFARKKYSPELIWSSDKSQLKRLTCTKETLKQKLRQLEISVGCYVLGGKPAPQESLVVYIHPNPRSQKQAARILLKKMADLIADNNVGFNVQAEALSAIQKSRGQKPYVDFDFDLTNKDEIKVIMRNVLFCINDSAVTFVETRGGLHVLVKTALIAEKYKKTWYQSIIALGSDVAGDCMLPIPGCCQGGFVPKIIKYDTFELFSLPSFPTVTENKSNETPILITVYNFKSSEDLLFAQDHIPSNIVVKLAVNYPDLFLIAFKPSNLIDSKHIEYLTLICNKCLKIEVPTSRIFETDYPTLINSISDDK